MTEVIQSGHAHCVEEAVKNSVSFRCHGRIQRLAIHVEPDRVVVRGSASSYYAKQLALEGAKAALKDAGYSLQVEIDVP